MADLHWLGVRELAQRIRAKEVSPVEVVRAHLDRINNLDGHLKCYLAVFAEEALASARDAETMLQRGQPIGPLHGVPIAVKDLFAVRGTPTTAGSRVPTTPAVADCTVVARLRTAGAIILGKLNMHEFAYGPEGINPHFGTPYNPWDPNTQRMPGGSSSGSGVAVAAGLAPVALGSDTGGSIRIPAACCGVTGLKPTYGRVSRAGVLPLSWSLDHAGPLARSVADAALIVAAIAGRDPADNSTSSRPVPDYLQNLALPPRGLRVGVLREYLDQANAEVRQSVTDAVKVFQNLHCPVDEVSLRTAKYSLGAAQAILAPEALVYHEPLLRRHGALYGPDVRRRLLTARVISARDYLNGQRARSLIRQDVNDVLARVDCLLAPTLPIPAPPITADEVEIGTGKENARAALTMFTRLFNLSGHPALSLPCGFTDGGLPLSLQLVGRPFDEETIVRLGHAYEAENTWHSRRPPNL